MQEQWEAFGILVGGLQGVMVEIPMSFENGG